MGGAGQFTGPAKVHMNATAQIIALQNQAGQKDVIVGKLHEQIRDLTQRLD